MIAQEVPASELVRLDIKGLPAAPITCLLKDHNGFLWIGTGNGLCRYDGLNVDVYRNIPGDSLSLQENAIRDLNLGPDGRIWVSCFGGLSVFDPRPGMHARWPRFERKALLAQKQMQTGYEALQLMRDAHDGIWASCFGNGLAKYDAASGIFRELEELRAALPPEQKGARTGSVLCDPDGMVWVSDRMSLYRFDPVDRSVIRYTRDPAMTDPPNRMFMGSIVPDPQEPDVLWLGSWGLGLVRFDKRTSVFTTTTIAREGSEDITNLVGSIQAEKDGRLLVSYDYELRWFDPRTSTFSRTLSVRNWKNGSFHANALVLLRDPDGRTWVGTHEGLFTLPTPPAGLDQWRAYGQSWCPAVDRDGYWAVRYYAQRTLFKIGAQGELLDSLPLPNAEVLHYEPWCVLQARDGRVWIGTSQGLIIYDPFSRSFEREPLSDIPEFLGSSPSVSSIIEQPDGTIWIPGTSSGLLSYQPIDKSFRFREFHFDARNRSGRHECGGLKGMDKDHIGIVFNWEGMGVLDTRTMDLTELNVRDTAGIALRHISSLVIHANGILHAVTPGEGVVVLQHDGRTIKRIATCKDEKDKAYTCNDATGDAAGNTWIATNTGLVKFDADNGSFQHYGPVDGLPVGDIPTIITDPYDRILAPSWTCIRFDPKTLLRDPGVSGLYVRAVAVNGSPEAIEAMDSTRIQLAHDRNSLTLEYAPIALLHADALRYEVMLEGHDPRWVDNGSHLTVSYVGLSPGAYTFRVRVTENENTRASTLFAFTIVPAWWQTWWFKIAASLLTGIIVFFSFRYVLGQRYQKRIAALEHERELGAVRTRIARDIHDDIGSGLTRITMLSREMKTGEGTDEKERLAGSIATASAELIGQLSEIVWTVDPKNDHAEGFIAYVRNLLGRQFEELSVTVRTDLAIDPGMEHRDIPPDVKRNVVMILKESVSNALKHANARTITVGLCIGADELSLRVEDDGGGFNTSAERARGNGLGNMRKRSEGIGGALEVVSDVTGTRYCLRVPLPSPTFMRDP